MSPPHSQDSSNVSGIIAALRSLSLFSPFNQQELADIAERSEIADFASGTALIEEGDPSDGRVYFILQGSVRVTVNDRFILALKKPGDIFGEMSLISDDPRSATVIADSETRCLVISSALNLEDDQDQHYKLRFNFTRMFSGIMADKLRITSERAKLYEDAIVQSQRDEVQRLDLERRVALNLRQIRIFSHLVEDAKDGILVTDLGGVVESANPALGESFAYSPEGPTGTMLHDVLELPESGDRSWEAIWEQAWEEGWKGEVIVNGSRGPVPADCTISLVRDQDHAPMAFSVILKDASERKAYEVRILDQQFVLEQAFGDLQKLDTLKDQFLSRTSHELRTPVTSLLGSLEMMSIPGMVEPDQQKEYIDMMLREAKKLGDMVDKVLAISKLEGGQADLEFSPVQMEELVAVEVAKIHGRAEEKQINLETHVDGPLEPVSADQEHIMTALGQILDNAVKFTDAGTIRVTLSQTEEEVVITIQDTGRGIEPEILPSIFNKLGQLQDNIDQNRGLGLGLPLSYLIVQEHSGRLLVNSSPGEGSVFTIGLPRMLRPATPHP